MWDLDPRILLGVCFVMLFIIMYLVQNKSCSTSPMIPGFWSVSEQFKEKAGIEQLIFYFGEGTGHEYKGYMILEVDGETLVNEVTRFRITPRSYFRGDYSFLIHSDIKHMPKKMIMSLNPCNGLMTLKHNGKLYAQMLKDNQLSAKTILNIEKDAGGLVDTSDEESDEELNDADESAENTL